MRGANFFEGKLDRSLKLGISKLACTAVARAM
jgi:hypothetical protein